ncbi:MAG: DUF3662 and FHA domain-containing protein [Varibaculum sp.]|nr:DUF3662 and FHA domain-containing protein [Varibaculum sp.]
MGMIDRFEKAVEQGVNAPFSKIFRSRVKAVDIATAMRETMDENINELADGSALAPNEFDVYLAPADLDAVENSNSQALTSELAEQLTDHATELNYAFVGPIAIRFNSDPGRSVGTLKVDCSTKRGAAAPVTTAEASPEHPIIDIEGRRWMLTEPVTVIGRGSGSDIIVNDTGISRRHLELRITPTGIIATDLGSTNGTYVEGHRVDAATLLDGNEITIGRTHILFWTSAYED